ncbi:MAG TPA: response regulator [Jiangellaceae bacterium]
MNTTLVSARSSLGHVLVVDDDPKFTSIAVRTLERAGYRCTTGASGEQALRAAQDNPPDAIVLDLVMPRPNGIEVCDRLRTSGWAGGVIIVSARNGAADRAIAAAAGADAFLGKPFLLDDLVYAVDTLVRPL